MKDEPWQLPFTPDPTSYLREFDFKTPMDVLVATIRKSDEPGAFPGKEGKAVRRMAYDLIEEVLRQRRKALKRGAMDKFSTVAAILRLRKDDEKFRTPEWDETLGEYYLMYRSYRDAGRLK